MSAQTYDHMALEFRQIVCGGWPIVRKKARRMRSR